MVLDTAELFERSLDKATWTIGHLTQADYKKPTPIVGKDARTLANDMLYELSWIPEMLAGERISDVGTKYDGDLLDEDSIGAWTRAAALAKGEVRLYDPHAKAHLSYADVPNYRYLHEVAGYLMLHSWDLAAALGLDRSLDYEAAATAYQDMRPELDKIKSSGVYGPPIKEKRFSDPLAKLLALTGRDPSWQPA